MYANKIIYIATKHQKEQVIKPAFEQILSCHIKPIENFDTDMFGTFSGEVERKLSTHDTCIHKAKQAAQRYGFPYVIASEGSFGPHPSLYFVPGNIEEMTFIDTKRDITITERLISTETNFAHLDLGKTSDLDAFLVQVQFPSHRLILRNVTHNTIIQKAINNLDELNTLIEKHSKKSNLLRLETDMRAMYNPTRMSNIGQLAQTLARRIVSKCPKCNTPGFGKVSHDGLLPCRLCSRETKLYKYKVLKCIYCDYLIRHEREDNKKFSDPMYCDFCNP